MIKLNKENVKDFQPETEKDYKRYEMDHPQIKNKINSIYEKVNFSSPGDRKKAIEVGNMVDAVEEIAKLQSELEYTEGFMQSVKKKLSNEHFVQNAPAQVVDKERQKMDC